MSSNSPNSKWWEKIGKEQQMCRVDGKVEGCWINLILRRIDQIEIFIQIIKALNLFTESAEGVSLLIL